MRPDNIVHIVVRPLEELRAVPYVKVYEGLPVLGLLEEMVADGRPFTLPAIMPVDPGKLKIVSSYLRVQPPRDLVITKIEYHFETEEALYCFNGPCINVIGPPVVDPEMPLAEILKSVRAYLMPPGTGLRIAPQVIHCVSYVPKVSLLQFLLPPQIASDPSLSVKWEIPSAQRLGLHLSERTRLIVGWH